MNVCIQVFAYKMHKIMLRLSAIKILDVEEGTCINLFFMLILSFYCMWLLFFSPMKNPFTTFLTL